MSRRPPGEGLFRTENEGETFPENLGLSFPSTGTPPRGAIVRQA